MSKTHNKKRNVGIIYELLLRYISNALIEDRKLDAQKALQIIEKNFNKHSEIYKEFRLFNALVKSTVSDTAVVAAILTEAKKAARRLDNDKLDKEKSFLIRAINHKLADKSFYHRRIPEYRAYGTIQLLLNDWYSCDASDLAKMVKRESQVAEWLLKEKKEVVSMNINSDIDNLVVNIMTDKINSKYKNTLSEEQRNILKSYVFSIENDSGESIKKKLKETQLETLGNLELFDSMTDSRFLKDKIQKVKDKILCETTEEIDDDVISKYLVISHLKEEIREAINER